MTAHPTTNRRDHADKAEEHLMKRIVGYADEISVEPGQTIRFMVSCYGVPDYTASVVRLIHGDVNPAGPGFRSEPVSQLAPVQCQGREQVVQCGSYAWIAAPDDLQLPDSVTVQAFVWPTLPGAGEQVILRQADGTSGVELFVTDQGHAAVRMGETTLDSGVPLLAKEWYLLTAACDAETGTLTLVQHPCSAKLTSEYGAQVEGSASVAAAPAGTPIVIGAEVSDDGPPRTVRRAFNGKIDRPRIAAGALSFADSVELGAPVPSRLESGTVIAAWDFSQYTDTQRVTDLSPNDLHGTLVNLPARAMKGANWTGQTMNWQDDPSQYGAIHFHDDDVYDAQWEVDFEFTIPAGLRSGVYAARLEGEESEDYIPFVVRPAARGPRADVALVLPTSSYLAYANEHMPTDAPLAQLLTDQVVALQPEDLFLAEHREFGGSTYDTHTDGSGICYSSRLRPVLNMRPKYADWLGGSGSALWQFNADLHITDWLEHSEIGYDVITDEDLQRDGYAAVGPYRVLLTGTHPEYTSTRMRATYETFTAQGGRLVYLGGNGFYWRISYSDHAPGAIEVRKAEGGIRAWAAEPGEYYNAFDGAYSGLWRRSARPPQDLVGVGFSAQGFDVSSYYRREPGSEDPRAAFIFEGISDEIIGDFGLIGGGAAGLELDRADRELGTPDHALVLASSEQHTDIYLVVLEEILINAPGLHGQMSPLVRADLVFFETAGGGAVFSTGSIAFCGSLSHNGYDNNVSRMIGNVVRRFADPEPFVMPGPDASGTA